MAHHKKRKSRNARAGCKMCKPWKASGSKRQCEHISQTRAREWERSQRADVYVPTE